MKKQYIIYILTLFIFSCGNAETTEKEVVIETPVVVEGESGNQSSIEDNSVVIEEPIKEEGSLEQPLIDEAKKEMEEVVEVEEVKELEEQTKSAPIRVNHTAWDVLTKKYVTAVGKVNYKGFKSEIKNLETYLTHLKETVPQKDWNRNEKMAYWINLYNASTVYLVASNYPITSIMKIDNGKAFDRKFVKSGDKVYSLNDIEHKIVRPTFKDARVHVALNCAAVSCPNLLNEAFLPTKLNTQLDKQARLWFSSSKNKVSANKVELSQIFEWYSDDFISFKGGIIGFVNKYSKEQASENANITYLKYDWALNE